MRTLPIVALALCLSPLACDHPESGIKGSGNTKTEARTVSGFSQVALASAGDLTLTQGSAESLTIEAEDNLLSHLRSTVKGDQLMLDTDADIQPTKPVRYTLTVKNLTALDVSGAGDVAATGLQTSALRVRITGAGDVSLAGQAGIEDVALTGAGDYKAAGLVAKGAKIAITGAGNAVVQASETLDVNITGTGNVEYIGDPKVTKQVAGLDVIKKR